MGRENRYRVDPEVPSPSEVTIDNPSLLDLAKRQEFIRSFTPVDVPVNTVTGPRGLLAFFT